jgi:geranylgeranyl diphosphate synthase type I
LSEFTRMQVAAIAGQQLDVVGRTRNVLSVYELKTGSYTVHGPLALGLLLGGASPDTLKLVDDFAVPVGIAFQLRDDLLNLFSPPTETGKPQGSDITAGKWTWTAQWLHRNTASSERPHFDAAFGNRNAEPAVLNAALEEVSASGARAATERYLAELERRSAAALTTLLASLDSPERGRILLQSAVSALLHRSA